MDRVRGIISQDAHYFAAMMVRFGSLEKAPFPVLPYGWAAVLELYGLR